ELSTHMRGLPRICVGLVKFGATHEWLRRGSCVVPCCQGAFHTYAWAFYAYAWMSEAWGSQGHVWACLNVTLEHELAGFPRICVDFYAYA
ncbi:hypothetical protein PIB30_099469, partial [Stylosanthes scabra]|nr:hypothetical protein [Stylosanthes scabra]